MFNQGNQGEDHNYYDGCRVFETFANFFGLSVDLMNFLICQILALLLATLFRSTLHRSKVSSEIRHIFGLAIGLCFGYFCFGQQAIHIAGLPALCYIVIRTHSPEIVQISVMIVALFYLLCIHLHRQIYDYGSYSLDITGPLMIITQKVTSLAYSIHDGFTRRQKDLTETQQYHAIHRLPSALEYFSYVLNFQGLMAGPMVFYKDYIDFIEGYNLLKHSGNNSNLDNNNAKQIIIEPSPIKSVIDKIIQSVICAFIFMKYIQVFPIKTLKDDDFIENTTFIYKFWYIIMATTIVRFKYYHAWLWADAICNNAGLGFSGYDIDGSPKWDLLSNINVLSFEFSTNMRNAINNWNIVTNKWLRFIVYERVPKQYGTSLTFGLSALWHGFYPGYYLTFATGALFVEAARVSRKMFRHHFQSSPTKRVIYDMITYIVTRISMGYVTFPFVLLEFWTSMEMYLKFYMCLHLVAFATIYVLPKFIKGQTIRKKSSSINDFIDNDENLSKGDHVNNTLKKRKILIKTNHDGVILTKTATNNDSLHINHNHNDNDDSLSISYKIKEKIEAETKNLEEFIYDTVNGIVELKDNLMRMNDNENNLFLQSQSSTSLTTPTINNEKFTLTNDNVDKFLKKEIDAINAAVQQVNVLPAVLSNGHAK